MISTHFYCDQFSKKAINDYLIRYADKRLKKFCQATGMLGEMIDEGAFPASQQPREF